MRCYSPYWVGCTSRRWCPSLMSTQVPPLENWLRNIRDTYRLNRQELDRIYDKDQRTRRLVELNTIEQAFAVFKTGVVQRRRVQTYGAEDEPYTQPRIHAVVFDPGASRRPVAFARIGPISKNKAPTASSDGDESRRWRHLARNAQVPANSKSSTSTGSRSSTNWGRSTTCTRRRRRKLERSGSATAVLRRPRRLWRLRRRRASGGVLEVESCPVTLAPDMR